MCWEHSWEIFMHNCHGSINSTTSQRCSGLRSGGHLSIVNSLSCSRNQFEFQLVLWGPKCARKISPTPLTQHHQPEPLIFLTYCLHQILTQPSECHSRNWDFQIFCCPVLVSPWELHPQFPVLSWQEWHQMCSSAAVAHLLQGSTCCTFRDALLHTLV